MFRQHQIVCENKRIVIYLFLYEQEIDLDTMKTIFSQISAELLDRHICEYFDQNHIRFLGTQIRIVYKATIIHDFLLHEPYLTSAGPSPTNIINFCP